LAAILVDQGKLDFHQPVVDFLPHFELSDVQCTRNTTVQDLLSHNTGLDAFSGDNLTYLGWHQDGIIENLKYYPLKKETPHFSYQNVLYGLTGLILEKIQKESLPDMFRELVFKPLEL